MSQQGSLPIATWLHGLLILSLLARRRVVEVAVVEEVAVVGRGPEDGEDDGEANDLVVGWCKWTRLVRLCSVIMHPK